MTALAIFDKIKALVYTEKSNQQLAGNKYHFQIDDSCNKGEVASLIKKVFGVEVTKVNIINTPNKTRKFKGIQGESKGFKKAIVTIKEGQTINFGS
jgi:large subunit ribosomal protein L23